MISHMFWLVLCRIAFRHLARGAIPTGTPGYRDARNTCDAYAPRPATRDDWCTCVTDGHPLCAECCHADPHIGVRVCDPTCTREQPQWYVN